MTFVFAQSDKCQNDLYSSATLSFLVAPAVTGLSMTTPPPFMS